MEPNPGNAINFDPQADYKKEVMEAAVEKPAVSPEQLEARFEVSSPEHKEDDKKIEELHAQLATNIIPEEKMVSEQIVVRSPVPQEKVTNGEWAGAIGSIGATIGLSVISIPAIASDLAAGAITNYATAGPAIYLGSATAFAAVVSGVVIYQIAQKLRTRRA
jgi:hypothetical protein